MDNNIDRYGDYHSNEDIHFYRDVYADIHADANLYLYAVRHANIYPYSHKHIYKNSDAYSDIYRD